LRQVNTAGPRPSGNAVHENPRQCEPRFDAFAMRATDVGILIL
jgi:hypothetical protein